MNHNNRG